MKRAQARPVKRIIIALLATLALAGCGSTAVSAAATSGTPSAPTASALARAARLAKTYSLTLDNLTYALSSGGALTQVAENAAGDISGQLISDPPLYGSGPFTGTVNGNTIKFTARSAASNPANATSTDFTGVIDSRGSLSGTYIGYTSDGRPPEKGTWTAVPAVTSGQGPSPLSVDAGANQTILGTNIISLDGQVTGDAADVAWTQVSGPGTTNFASSDSGATTATVSTPGTYVFQLTAEGDGTSASGQVTIRVQAYVALGDSYSAGDGAGDYLADSADPRCLQSANAYPELVDAKVAGVNAIPAGTANPAFVFAACTAAEIPNFNSPQSHNQPAQLSYLKNLPANSVGLVTLTIGGNDAGFGKIMRYCAKRKDGESCQEHSQAEVNQIILKQLPLKLFDLYRQIKSEPSLAPNAQILVLGYPQFFPTGQATSCPTHDALTGAFGYKFQPSDMAWIDSVIKLVDSDIQASASAASLTYVDTSNAFAGNQLCQPNPDLNDAVIGPGLSFEGYPVGIQSFHPNAAGQSVLAQNVSPAVPFPTS
jgi:lysophospholipase L1-like esterase